MSSTCTNKHKSLMTFIQDAKDGLLNVESRKVKTIKVIELSPSMSVELAYEHDEGSECPSAPASGRFAVTRFDDEHTCPLTVDEVSVFAAYV